MVKLNYNRFKKNNNLNQTVVYAIAGGKHGIGTSFITNSLALYLAKSDLKTLIIDLDFRGTNAHAYLRVPSNDISIKNYLSGETSDLNDVVVPTQFKNLNVISGTSNQNEVFVSNTKSLSQLLKAARQLGFDRIIYDLGTGTETETIEAFLNADVQLVVSTPEPISVENTYNLLKHVFYKSFEQATSQHKFKDSINSILNNKAYLRINTPADLLRCVAAKFPNTGNQIVKVILNHKPQIIITQCRSSKDQKIGKSLSYLSTEYFGQEIGFLGYLNFNNHIWGSMKTMKPFLLESPNASVLKDFRTLFSKIENKVNVGYINIAT